MLARPQLPLILGLGLSLAACASLTEPGSGAPPPQPEPVAAQAPEPPPTPPAAPTPPPAPEESIAASHILLQYKGSKRAAPTVTRSKDEAKKLATEVMNKAKKKGQDFAALAKQYSDEPGAKDRAGSLGKFTKGQMVPAFSDAAFALKPGEISNVVETDFGFHVIKRTE